MFNRLRSLVVKELIQFTQDRLLMLFVLIGPLAQLLLIGGGVSSSLSDIATAVIDQDRSSLSREVIAALDNTQELSVQLYPGTLEEARDLIDAGQASALVVIPEGFSSDLQEGRTAEVQLIVDGTNVVVAGEAQAAAQGAIETLGWNVALASAGNMAPRGVDLRQEALYNQALDSKPYDLTAHMAFIIFQVAALAAVMSIVREREVGTLEQVAVTPVRQVELILGKAISPIIIGLVNFGILFVVVRLAFSLPMRGSIILLTLMTLLYLISEVCMALMISAISQTQQQAITILFIYIMLALTMSGYMVPISRLPSVLAFAANALPVQHYIAIVRSVMLKGGGVLILWPHMVALLVLDVIVVTVTAFMLRRLGR
ncbi:MAG TPA: ABC transporter permease [Chloroflexi bacterium]|nr:ABC transporter permease [Chloroflexota bacterium]